MELFYSIGRKDCQQWETNKTCEYFCISPVIVRGKLTRAMKYITGGSVNKIEPSIFQ